MKTLAFSLFFFAWTMLSVFTLPAHDGDAHEHEPLSHWGDELKGFFEQIETDPDAARRALQNFTKRVFNQHILAEEWSPLYFRVIRNGLNKTMETHPERLRETLSDVIRIHELELRILADLDTQKYARQIKANEAALEYYSGLAERLRPYRDTQETVNTDKQGVPRRETRPLTAAEKKEGERIGAHFKKFLALLATDPDAARRELDGYAAKLFQNHPLAEEWKELCFRLARDKEALLTEVIRFNELKLQMQSDIDPERFAQEIEEITKLVANLSQMATLLESSGELDTKKIKFNMESSQ